ncbi:aldo/keto reductase [Bacillus cereus group sp. BfR-BA-01380]|uniref:aldo/keto reductase n=1 Tax=Bacillus cereus group sp. BfR-BA-01380 TaxID=2920324 RepID=UPI001F5AE41D|nr:aldo/keto reductase [Bacillus cereus group sp. BfR-BA-01380]
MANIFKEWNASKLGLGTYNLSPDKGVSYQYAQSILKKAALLGVNILDTAPLYGGGYVEYLIGDSVDESDTKIINKVGRFESLAYRKLGTKAYTNEFMIRSQFDFSLRLLNRNKVDLLLIHEADWSEWWKQGFDNSAVLNVLSDLKKEGLVDNIGISLRDPFLANELCSTGLFDAILFVHYYNVLWQESRDIFFDAAKKNNMGISIGTPFKQGLLTSNDRDFVEKILINRPKDLTPSLIERLKKLHEISRNYEMPMPEIALRYLISDPDVDVVFAGPKNIEELEINVELANRGSLPNVLLDELENLKNIPIEEGYSYAKV